MIEPLPPGFAATRQLLHRAAERRIAPEREKATGRIGLRAHPGGFGTPLFGAGRIVRVHGGEIVYEGGGEPERRELLSGVEPYASFWLGKYFAFALEVLEALMADMPAEYTPEEPTIWPEHFDYALVAGVQRANYGFSPGDADHPEPYAYVGPWEKQAGPLWNATAFSGAELPLAEIDGALDWMQERLAALHA